MSVWGVEAGIAVLLAALAVPLAIGPIVYLHYRHHGHFAGWPALLTTVTFIYAWGLVAFTLFPLPTTSGDFCVARSDIGYWQLIPFASLGDIVQVVADSGPVGALTSSTFLQVFFNVVLLVPLGMLLAYRYRKSFGVTVLAGLGVSLLIELTQGTAIWGAYACPYRLADVDDLLTNTAGAAVGWIIGMALFRILPDAHPTPDPDLDPPTIRRRIGAGALDVLFLIVVGLVAQIALNAVLAPLIDSNLSDLSWYTTAQIFIGMIVTGIGLFLVVPVVRRDRATLGQVATWLVPASVDETGRPTRRAAVIRFAVRWLPVIAASYFQPILVLVVVFIYETVTVIARRDHRSLSGFASGTTTVTRRRFDHEIGGQPDERSGNLRSDMGPPATGS